MDNQKPIYKSSISLLFYFFRGMLAGGLLVLIACKVDYHFIAFYFLFAYVMILNRNSRIIEVYNDHFNIITPSFYGKYFTDSDIYYFKYINSFEFEKGYYDSKFGLVIVITRIIFPRKFGNWNSAYINPSITFTMADEKETNIEFYDTNNGLIKAMELIDKEINHTPKKIK